MALHEFHARSLASTLTLADASVRRMEKLLTDGGEEGLIRSVRNSLSMEDRIAILQGVRALQRMLAEMAGIFSLPRSDLDLRRVLDAELTTLWVLFEDCRPERMKGYGQEFSPEDNAHLEETVNQLTSLVGTMTRQL